jgi:hypothetical protein
MSFIEKLTCITFKSINIPLSINPLGSMTLSLVPKIPNPCLEAFAGELFYGSVFCTLLCLPHVASYITAVGASFCKSVFITSTYNSGRLLAYALIGGARILIVLGVSAILTAIIATPGPE